MHEVPPEHNILLLLRVVKHWNRLLREAVKPPPAETFKTQLEMVLGNLLYLTMLDQKV